MEEIQHERTYNIVCPWCGSGYDCTDFYDLSDDDDGEMECDDCGKEFTYIREIEITFSTSKKESKE